MKAKSFPTKRNSGGYSRVNLTKAHHCRAELAKLYREARRGEIKLGDATRLAYLLQILTQMIKDQNLEARITALEEAAHGKTAR